VLRTNAGLTPCIGMKWPGMNPGSGIDPRSGLRYLVFADITQPHPASAIVFLHEAGERGFELTDVARYELPAMLSQGRAGIRTADICPSFETGADGRPDRVATFIRSIGDHFVFPNLMG
jgi:hypothetical protein